MNLDFSPEQKQFREQLRRFLQKSDGLSQARSILDGKVQITRRRSGKGWPR